MRSDLCTPQGHRTYIDAPRESVARDRETREVQTRADRCIRCGAPSGVRFRSHPGVAFCGHDLVLCATSSIEYYCWHACSEDAYRGGSYYARRCRCGGIPCVYAESACACYSVPLVIYRALAIIWREHCFLSLNDCSLVQYSVTPRLPFSDDCPQVHQVLMCRIYLNCLQLKR